MRTKIFVYVSDAKPIVGESVKIGGNIRYYDEREKRWIPFKARLEMFVNGELYDTKYSGNDGSFEFEFKSDSIARYEIEVVFKGNGFEPCSKKTIVEFIAHEEKKRIERIAKIVLILIIALIVLSYLFIVFIKSR